MADSKYGEGVNQKDLPFNTHGDKVQTNMSGAVTAKKDGDLGDQKYEPEPRK